jgi:hypothetical protein
MNQSEILPLRVRRSDAAKYLREKHGVSIAAHTLANLAVSGGGPSFQKIAGRPLYPLAELDEWVSKHRLVSKTSELAAV